MKLRSRIKQAAQGYLLEVSINGATFAPLSGSDGTPVIYASRQDADGEQSDLMECFEVMTADYSQKPKDPKAVIQQMVLNL